MKVIGLSLSRCIAEIVEGKVKEDDVIRIISRTGIVDDSDWNEVMSKYKMSFWKSDPDIAENLARKFWDAGKIEQPRLGFSRQYPDISRGVWAKNETDIVWCSME